MTNYSVPAAFRQQSRDTAETRQEFDIQRFEQTFFNLVNLHHQNLNTIEQRYRQESSGDTHFFAAAFRFLEKHSGPEAGPEARARTYQSFYRQHYNHIDHFARHLLFSMQYIQQSQHFEGHPHLKGEEERQKYLNILQAQLSTDELTLLYYHLHFDPAGPGEKILFESILSFFDRVPARHRLSSR